MKRTLRMGVASLVATIAALVGPGVASASSTTPPALPASAGPLQSGYLIQNVKTGLCVDLPGYFAPAINSKVTQWYCTPGDEDNQEFIFDRAGSGYLIRSTKGDICLDLPGYFAASPGTKVSTFTCQSSGDNQIWNIEWYEGYFLLRNVASDLCLDVPGIGSGGPDVQLEVYPCTTDPNDDHFWYRW